MRFDYLSRETYAEHSDGAKALDLRLLWPVLPNLWLLLVTYQEKRPEFENNRYCYCCIVGIVGIVIEGFRLFKQISAWSGQVSPGTKGLLFER